MVYCATLCLSFYYLYEHSIQRQCTHIATVARISMLVRTNMAAATSRACLVLWILLASSVLSSQARPPVSSDAHMQLARDSARWSRMLSIMLSSLPEVQSYLVDDDLGLAALSGALQQRNWQYQNEARPAYTVLRQLVETINSNYHYTGKPISLEDATSVAHHKSTVKVVGGWWSNPVDVYAMTSVATTASLNRLPQLAAQCRSWPGILSVALYQPLLSDSGSNKRLSPANQQLLRSAVLQVTQFLLEMSKHRKACKPDILLVWEMYENEEALESLYPYNILRNLARVQVRTPLVAMLDVDLVISRHLYKRLCHPAYIARNQLLEQTSQGTVFIIPAFDVNRRLDRGAWADALVSSKKDIMVYAYTAGIVFQFDKDGFSQGHNLTNYARWITSTQDYEVTYTTQAEPWFVGDRQSLPWHDVRYRGYGRDKVQFVADTASKGFKFKVFHNTFLVHREHKQTLAKTNWMRRDAKYGNTPNPFTRNLELYTTQIGLHRQGVPFTAPEHPAIQACKQALPWLQHSVP